MSNIDITDVVAHVKQEFILPVETREAKPESNEGASEDQTKAPEPPHKKQKLTGTNKHRPKLQKAPKSSKLCRFLWCLEEGEDAATRCSFPECDFIHDISAYLGAKPADLGQECHNYRTYGRCHYGLVCRFGGDHIEGERNKVKQEVWAKHQDNPTVANTLSKEVQHTLRKRQYNFAKAKEAHRIAQSEVAKSVAAAKTTTSNATEATTITTTADSTTPACDGTPQDESANIDQICSNTTHQLDDSSQIQTAADDSSQAQAAEEGREKGCVDGTNVENGGSTEGKVTPSEQQLTEEGEKVDKHMGPVSEEDLVKLTTREKDKKRVDWQGKTYLAPLTTLGNLPFRRICKRYGADITCGEMALASCLLQGSPSEWALVKKHASEDCFGIQVCGSNAQTMIKCAQLMEENVEFDFIDINMGCPIDFIYKQGGGSALMRRQSCLEHMVRGMTKVLTRPLTLKMRTAVYHDTRVAHTIIQRAKLWDVSMVTVHGRSREQRYLKLADWDYVKECATLAAPLSFFGNGDILSYEDYNHHTLRAGVSGVMIGRGALIKPWIFKEIKEQRHWDITSSERLEMLKEYTNYGMEHWGSDTEGVEKTRRFLLEWLSFLHRYVPVGLLEQTQKINQRPPAYRGRDHLETLMASRSVVDWIKISEMLLGPTPADFAFLPKHKANAY